MTEEILVITFCECRRARASAHKYLLCTFGNSARRFRCGTVVRSDDCKDFLLIIETFGFRLCHIRFALVVGLDYFDLIASENTFLCRKGSFDLGILLIDDICCRKNRINAVLSGNCSWACEREEDTNLYNLVSCKCRCADHQRKG